jgi:integrase
MVRKAKALKALQVQNARKHATPRKLHDGEGLYLYITAGGFKSWRMDYRFGGTRRTVVHGQYGAAGLSLEEARGKNTEARKLLGKGLDPAEVARQCKNARSDANVIRSIGEAWFAEASTGKSASWKDNNRRWLDKRIYPVIGGKHFAEVTAAEVMALCKGIQREGRARTAVYVRRLVAEVYDYGVSSLVIPDDGRNPARAIKKTIRAPKAVSHPELAEREIPAFLKKAEAYDDRAISLAVRLLLLTFTRKLALIGARWPELALDDLERAEWRIPPVPGRVKGKEGERREHLVPLSRQAVVCFRALKPLAGGSDFVFPSPYKADKHIGRGLLNKAFERMGYKGRFSPHGVRSTASTILNERSGFAGDVIEAQLSHAEPDQVRASYNRAQWLDQRRKLLQWWADYLDGNVTTADNVTPIKRAAA